MTNLNLNFKPVTDNSADAESNVKSALRKLDSTTKSNFSTMRSLAIAVCDYAYFIGTKENNKNVVPDKKDLTKGLNKLIDDMYSSNEDTDIISRLKSSTADSVRIAQLVIGENTGYIIGYRKAGRTQDTFQRVLDKDAINATTGELKNGIIQDIFVDESKTFPIEMKNGTATPRVSTHILARQAFIRDSHSLFFGDGKLNSDSMEIEDGKYTAEDKEVKSGKKKIDDPKYKTLKGSALEVAQRQDKKYTLATHEEFKITLDDILKKIDTDEGYLHLIASDKKRLEMTDTFSKLAERLVKAIKENEFEENKDKMETNPKKNGFHNQNLTPQQMNKLSA